LEFGDGASTTDPMAVHPCGRSGFLTSLVTVTDVFGRTAIATSDFICLGIVHQQGRTYSLTYGWLNFAPDPGLDAGKFLPRRMAFEAHVGSTVSGFYSDTRRRRTHFTGRLSGDRSIHIALDDGSVEFSGEVLLDDVAQDSAYYVNRTLKLVAKGGRDDGRKLDFEFYDPF
jgi:hypothetical protein